MINREATKGLAGRAVSLPVVAWMLAMGTPAGAQESSAPAAGPGDIEQATESGAFEEIVVTARRRAETMIDVPVAVTVLGGADIDRYAATDLTKIAQLAPQVSVERSGFSGSGAILSIRGIGSSPLDPGLVSSVSVNIDGTQISRGRVITQGFFDLQQVEVLKGPQALFFGKNSPAGVISLTSAGPTETFEGYARTGYEFRADERFLEGAISGPITDTLGFRIAARASKMSGYTRFVGGPFDVATDPGFPRVGPSVTRGPHTREFLGRLTLAWKPTSDFSATLRVFGSDFRDDAGPNSSVEVICADPNGRPQTTDFTNFTSYEDPYGDCRIDGRTSATNLPVGHVANFPNALSDGGLLLDYHAVISSLSMSYDLGSVELSSITSYVDMRTEYFVQADVSGVGVNWASNTLKSRMFTQEFRAATNFDGPLNGMLGVFYGDERSPFSGNAALFSFTTAVPNGLDPTTGRFDTWELRQNARNRAFSVFGQVTYDLTETLELSAGARYSRETKRASAGHVYIHDLAENIQFTPGINFLLGEGQVINGRLEEDNISPEVSIAWHPTARSTIYAAYKTGYKSGGFSQPVTLNGNFTADTLAFDAEKVRGFEVGAKGYLLDSTLRLGLTAYRYTYSDLQVQTLDNSTVSFNITNAASTRTTGFELEANYLVTPEFRLRGALGYNEAKYLRYEGAQCYPGQAICSADGTQDLSGRRLPRAPKVVMAGGASYETPLTTAFNLGLSADVRYSGSYFADETLNPVGRQSDYWVINGSARLTRPDDSWELALIGRNLTNERYMVSALNRPFGAAGELGAAVARPREILLQATARF